MSKKKPETTDEQHGARSFVHFLADLADGHANRELSADLRKLSVELNDLALSLGATVKGELSVKLIFKAEKTGVVTVTCESNLKLPKRPTPGGVMWLTTDGHLTAANPKQLSLGALREIPGGRAPIRDVFADNDEEDDGDDVVEQ